MEAGETLRFDLTLIVTPFKPIDTDGQWATRFYHRYVPVDEVRATGATVVNVHHATPINPWINYPFIEPARDEGVRRRGARQGAAVKIYYTVRELSNQRRELFALRSLGHEVFSRGARRRLLVAAGAPRRRLHRGVVRAGDQGRGDRQQRHVAAGTTTTSRGCDWLAENVGIDGLYLDDVAFDRTTMKRVRKVLDRGDRPERSSTCTPPTSSTRATDSRSAPTSTSSTSPISTASGSASTSTTSAPAGLLARRGVAASRSASWARCSRRAATRGAAWCTG